MLRALASTIVLAFLASGTVAARAAESDPPWLQARAGTIARVDIAPWPVADEPEAALTISAASLEQDFTANASRPGDVRYGPVGVVVRIVRVLPGKRVALVHGMQHRWEAYARIERLVPEVPPGTTLVAAGGFGGFADFYSTLATTQAHAGRIATGSRLTTIGSGVAPYDPDSSGLVRVHVRVVNGAARGRTGWIATGYTGLPRAHVPSNAEVAARACTCRLIEFDPAR